MSKRNRGLKNVASVVVLLHCNLFQTPEQHCCQGGLQLCIYQSYICLIILLMTKHPQMDIPKIVIYQNYFLNFFMLMVVLISIRCSYSFLQALSGMGHRTD